MHDIPGDPPNPKRGSPSQFPFPFALVVRVLSDIGWTCGCWHGYPNRWYKRTRLVRLLADRFDPVVFP